MVKLLRITESPKPDKKYRAVFQTDKGREKNVDFGAKGMGDFIQYSKESKEEAEKRKSAYLARHKVNEDWSDPTKPGALSKFLLWNKPTLVESLRGYRAHFNV